MVGGWSVVRGTWYMIRGLLPVRGMWYAGGRYYKNAVYMVCGIRYMVSGT